MREEEDEEELVQKVDGVSELKSNTRGTDTIETGLLLWSEEGLPIRRLHLLQNTREYTRKTTLKEFRKTSHNYT